MTSFQLEDNERIDDLYCQGLKVIQSTSAPGFSIDAILLADFVKLQKRERLIDLGTGTAVIPLLLAAKEPKCRIQALELMPAMAAMARRSVILNGLNEQIQVQEGDIRQAAELYGRAAFDVAVSNPPYYKVGAGKVSSDPLRAAARSESFCSLSELLDTAAALLKPLGRFYVVHRAERLEELLVSAEKRRLHCCRLRMVHPRAEKEANLLLAQFSLGRRGQLHVEAPLMVYQAENIYSDEMKLIYMGRGED
ncbi:MAG: tRNA1(Val) (adenine(37)-N6)-methyltransferase [Bacillota bacterium]|nr:tRNA1(Val) (adenine(37)-N6)-methyltransferase [Bacillota bacterium]